MHSRWIVAVLLVTGCATNPLPGDPPDGGAGSDGGSQLPDLAGIACAAIPGALQSWVDAHQSCTVDADCRNLYTGCGLVGQCGGFINVAGDNGYLTSLVDQWNSQCNPPWCDCPAMPDWEAGCNGGVCGPRMTPLGGDVGAPCNSSLNCKNLECVTEQASGGLFPGGYCTLINCGGDIGCPPGSACFSVGNVSYCLAECPFFGKQDGCRPGYCCGGPPHDAQNGWCAPEKSLLCGAG